MIVAVVSAYNEGKTIAGVVKKLLSCVDTVLVVDDASQDDTYEQARQAGAVVLRHKINRGQGAALETGHTYARTLKADFVVHFDGDGQFDPTEVLPAIEALKTSGADILLGSRFLDTYSVIPFSKRFIVLPLARLFDRVFSGLSLTDSHNGFRVFNNKALHALKLTQDRMAHASEVPALIKKHGLKYIEFPVTVRYVEYGQQARGAFHIIKDTLTGLFLR